MSKDGILKDIRKMWPMHVTLKAGVKHLFLIDFTGGKWGGGGGQVTGSKCFVET